VAALARVAVVPAEQQALLALLAQAVAVKPAQVELLARVVGRALAAKAARRARAAPQA
jgi:hypothetical protein